jgi:type I restriction enzyme R subunit
MNGVLNHTDTDLPDSLREKPVAAAFFGLTSEFLNEKISDQKVGKLISEQASHSIDQMVKTAVFGSGPKAIVDWENKDAITGKLIIEIGDYLIDEVRDKYQLELSFSELDELAVKILEVAKRRYKS